MTSSATLISNMRRVSISTTKLRRFNVTLVRVVVGTLIVLMTIGAHIKPADCGTNRKFLSGFLIALLLCKLSGSIYLVSTKRSSRLTEKKTTTSKTAAGRHSHATPTARLLPQLPAKLLSILSKSTEHVCIAQSSSLISQQAVNTRNI